MTIKGHQTYMTLTDASLKQTFCCHARGGPGCSAENQGKPNGVIERWPRRPFVEATNEWAA